MILTQLKWGKWNEKREYTLVKDIHILSFILLWVSFKEILLHNCHLAVKISVLKEIWSSYEAQ